MSKNENKLPLINRLWIYQWERIPVLLMAMLGSVNVGVIYSFSKNALFPRYFIALLICICYMIQIRASDEKKDFEHDNKFHKKRPVQRGLVTLAELSIVNKIMITLQLLLYASFLNAPIMLMGILSQSYAYLTRKEFFIRDWLRPHFHLYNITHYVQLLILQYAIILIVVPVNISKVYLILYAVIHASLMEFGRKMYATEDDTTDDSYSAQFGVKQVSVVLSIVATLSTLFSLYFINIHHYKKMVLVLPILVLVLLYFRSYKYAFAPTRPNSKAVQISAVLMYFTSMLAVVIGAVV